MSRNLLKAQNVASQEKEIRIIDNNETIARRLEWLAEQAIIPSAGGYDGETEPAEDADSSAADLLCGGEGAQQDGFVEGIMAQQAEIYTGPSPEEIAAQAKEEARQLLENAKAEVEKIHQEARDGGFRQGYEDGMREAEEHLRQEEQRLKEKEAMQEQVYWTKVEELEPAFVNTLTDIYEHVFRVDLSSHRQLITGLLAEAMRGIEGCRNFILHVSREDLPAVKAAIEEITAAAAAPDVTVDLIEDATLSKNEALIETDSGIYDCSLGTQLEGLSKQLKLLSYSK